MLNVKVPSVDMLSVNMLSVIMVSAIMVSVISLSVIMVSVLMLSVNMLSVNVSFIIHSIIMLSTKMLYHYAECSYDQYHSAVCHCAKWRGIIFKERAVYDTDLRLIIDIFSYANYSTLTQ
jgi:hypothetical protein